MSYSLTDISGITSQHNEELKLFLETPPTVDLVIEGVVPDSGGSVGEIKVRGTSPDASAFSFEYDIDGAGTWANTQGVFIGLAAGVHTVQARDANKVGEVSIVVSIAV